MTDSIDLLEAIGRDASLRHAPSHVLAATLKDASAPQVLTNAAATGDSTLLKLELGDIDPFAPQITQSFAIQL